MKNLAIKAVIQKLEYADIQVGEYTENEKLFKYQNSIKMKEIEALQNAGNNVGLVIHEKFQEDKRRTVNKYFATLDGISISPVLDYENLNYFILGYIKASTIINKQINSVC